MEKSPLEDYEIGGEIDTPNAPIVNQLFKNAQIGKQRKAGICTIKVDDNVKLSFPSKVCRGLIDVMSFKCDPKTDDKCNIV